MTMLGTGIMSEATRLLPKDLSMTILADRLKARREQRGLSQHEVAAAIGIKQPHYSRYENGTDPGTEMLARIAKALECTADYLLGIKDSPTEYAVETTLPADIQAWINIYKTNPRLVREFRRYLKRRPSLGPGTFFFEIPILNSSDDVPGDKEPS